MATNFFNKRDVSTTKTGGDDEVAKRFEHRRRLPVDPMDPTIEPQQMAPDEGSVGQAPQTPQHNTQVNPQVQVPSTVATDDTLTALSDSITNGSLQRSPYYQELLKTRDALIALKTQPTYVNKKGETVNGMEDKNGRLKSGLQAALERIGSYRGGFRSWGDVAGMLASGAGAGVGGAINSSWDEYQQRDNEIGRLEEKAKMLMSDVQFDSTMMNQQVARQNTMTDNNRADEQLKQRKRTDFYRGNKAFDPTKATEAQVKQLAEFGETPQSIGAYDFTKAEMKLINGITFKKNPISGAFERTDLPIKEGDTVVDFEVKDPDTDVVYKYSVPQAKAAQLRTNLISAGMQIRAAEERQATQIKANAAEGEKDRTSRERIAAANKQMTSAQLLTQMQKYADDNGMTLEDAKAEFTKSGVDVEGILKRQ